MSRLIEIIILAIIQGVTEFLPISSSGHLALLGNVFKTENIFELAVYMHFGTLLSILIVLRHQVLKILRGILRGRVVIDRHVKVKDPYLRLFFMIIVGSIPAAIAGLWLKDTVQASFDSVTVVGVCLLITGIVLLATRFSRDQGNPINWWRALVIGAFQAMAIFPGVSRSGMTISSGLYMGLDPADAFDFSFLLAIPAMIGASVLEFKDIKTAVDPVSIVVGVVASCLVGVLALSVLKRILVRRSFYLFSVYCLLLGLAIVLGSALRLL